MGIFQRPFWGGQNFWHFGALCFPMRLNTGSYAVLWQNGYGVVASYDICASGAQMGALHREIVRAVFQ